MAIPVKDTGGSGEFKKCPPGIHAAVCDMVVNVGNQRTTYMGQDKVQEKVYFRFEVPKQRIEYEKDGQKFNRPMSIGMMLTNSLSEKANLRKLLESWRGKAFTAEELKNFDLMKVLGVPCIITVEHKDVGDKTYANITAIKRFSESIEVNGTSVAVEKPQAEMPLIGYHPIYQPEHESELPEWLLEKIQSRVADEPHDASGETSASADLDEDIPF